MKLLQNKNMPIFSDKGVTLPFSPLSFDLSQTLDCGQAFRWKKTEDGYIGIAYQKICRISPIDNRSIFCAVDQADFEAIWRDYFDLQRDYDAIKQSLSTDPILAAAIAHAPGLRLLQQEPWEALCSFIISQNNNIPRIKGIIERLCELLGDRLEPGLYAFPTAARLAHCTVEQLAPLRAGFRARYLIDAAQRVASGEVVLAALHTLPLAEARALLCRITGVGIKVADCTLLYGCRRVDCIPVDVWIKRVLCALYPDGLPDCALPIAGIAQQYLFHYARTCPGALASKSV